LSWAQIFSELECTQTEVSPLCALCVQKGLNREFTEGLRVLSVEAWWARRTERLIFLLAVLSIALRSENHRTSHQDEGILEW